MTEDEFTEFAEDMIKCGAYGHMTVDEFKAHWIKVKEVWAEEDRARERRSEAGKRAWATRKAREKAEWDALPQEEKDRRNKRWEDYLQSQRDAADRWADKIYGNNPNPPGVKRYRKRRR